MAEFDLGGKRIWVTGHRGMVGSALVRRLSGEPCTILIADRHQLDLRDQVAVQQWIEAQRPDAIIIAAAKVGGILANDRAPADFLYDNLMIQTNLIHGAYRAGVGKLLFLGSSCIYPKFAEQPIREDLLMTGPLEPTNEWYAVAKIAGIKLCQAYRRQHGCDFISAMPTNLYGPGDNFDLTASHVLPALMRKIHEAKTEGRDTVEIWGSGRPLREFLYVDDLADALVHLLRTYSETEWVNVGTGVDVSITELAHTLAREIGYQGRFVFDASKPDGTPRKLLDVSKLAHHGWKASTALEVGIARTYAWFLEQIHGCNNGLRR